METQATVYKIMKGIDQVTAFVQVTREIENRKTV